MLMLNRTTFSFLAP